MTEKITRFKKEHQRRMLRHALRGRLSAVNHELPESVKRAKRKQDKILRKLPTERATALFLDVARTIARSEGGYTIPHPWRRKEVATGERLP